MLQKFRASDLLSKTALTAGITALMATASWLGATAAPAATPPLTQTHSQPGSAGTTKQDVSAGIDDKPATKKPAPPEPQLADGEYRAVVAELRSKNLLLPIQGANPETVKGSFYEMRGNQPHHAADFLSPRNTPILAVEDGTISKLWLSKAGGITIYEADPTDKFIYYYAHLERYADNLKEGDKVRRGQVIGFVGTSGNAPANTPHLHFSITEMMHPHQYWNGAPVDPYEVFSGRPGESTKGLPPTPPQRQKQEPLSDSGLYKI